jgi:hypothetical protein
LANADNNYFRTQALYAKGPAFPQSRDKTVEELDRELKELQEFRAPGDDQLRAAVHAAGTRDWCRAHLSHIALQVVVISVATMAFFLWNYLSGLFGPS